MRLAIPSTDRPPPAIEPSNANTRLPGPQRLAVLGLQAQQQVAQAQRPRHAQLGRDDVDLVDLDLHRAQDRALPVDQLAAELATHVVDVLAGAQRHKLADRGGQRLDVDLGVEARRGPAIGPRDRQLPLDREIEQDL
jgi:hypothetical protein